MPPRHSTVISTKGQVILPKAIRLERRWPPGTRLIVEETAEGVLLKTDVVFPRTDMAAVFGALQYDGLPKTEADMKTGLLAEAKRRHART